jgi:hypothetical protein
VSDARDEHGLIASCRIFLVPAQTQLTFKLYNPHTKKVVWRSLNASGFKPSADGRGGKANEFVRSAHQDRWRQLVDAV